MRDVWIRVRDGVKFTYWARDAESSGKRLNKIRPVTDEYVENRSNGGFFTAKHLS